MEFITTTLNDPIVNTNQLFPLSIPMEILVLLFTLFLLVKKLLTAWKGIFLEEYNSDLFCRSQN